MTRPAPSQRELAVLGMMAAGVAHDFNNLLVVILGAAEAILDRAEAGSATGADARQIRLAAERGAALVRQVLSLREGSGASVPEGVAVGDALAGLAPMLRYLLGPAVALSLETEQPGPVARIAAVPFERVILNLAANARNAMPAGGRLILRTRSLPGDEILIEVEDSGSGIPASLMPCIAEPFFTTRREQGGAGLGLATVHAILREAAGRLVVDSAPGRGTCMRVFLPCGGRERRENATSPLPLRERPGCPLPPAPSRKGRGRFCRPPPAGIGYVLVVEDEMPVRRLMERVLERAGWRVRGFGSAEAALDQERPAAVVSDLSLPGANGAQLIAQLRQRWPALPAILVSGYADSEASGHLPPEGGVFLAKPFTPADLLKALETCLAGADSETELAKGELAKQGQ